MRKARHLIEAFQSNPFTTQSLQYVSIRKSKMTRTITKPKTVLRRYCLSYATTFTGAPATKASRFFLTVATVPSSVLEEYHAICGERIK